VAGRHPSAVYGLHHVSIRVRDLERSLALYRDVLGLVVRTAFDLHGNRFAWLEAGSGRYIELVETGSDSRRGADGDVFWHLALRSRHLETSVEAVREFGCEITRPITPLDLVDRVGDHPFPVRVAFFRGPDGEDVELIEDETGQT
jgi:catechol 2,3-dioxygenase-like lactoylglutathione lyase family enzyme